MATQTLLLRRSNPNFVGLVDDVHAMLVSFDTAASPTDTEAGQIQAAIDLLNAEFPSGDSLPESGGDSVKFPNGYFDTVDVIGAPATTFLDANDDFLLIQPRGTLLVAS